MDALLTLEVSWHRGNSLPHTLLSCVYMTRVGIGALRVALGLPPAEGVEGAAAAALAAAAGPVVRGSVEFTTAFALLAFVTATARCVDATHRLVATADMFEVRAGRNVAGGRSECGPRRRRTSQRICSVVTSVSGPATLALQFCVGMLNHCWLPHAATAATGLAQGSVAAQGIEKVRDACGTVAVGCGNISGTQGRLKALGWILLTLEMWMRCSARLAPQVGAVTPATQPW